MTSRAVVVVHGGAWKIPEELTEASVNGVENAARAASKVLLEGGSALDAVEAAVRTMEDDPAFDAGFGSVLNAAGEVELDAAIMNGSDLSCGSVAAVRNIANPISLARMVSERTEHAMIVGDGANRFAAECGVPELKARDLVTDREWQNYERNKLSYSGNVSELMSGPRDSHDTVGCVCIDANGNLAAATSTGGIPMKRVGRVGDSPIIGAGLYADDALGAASTTGHGEALLKVVAAKSTLDEARVAAAAAGSAEKQSSSAQAGAERVLAQMKERLGSHGGIIAITPAGEVGVHFNTERMPWCVWRGSDNSFSKGIDP